MDSCYGTVNENGLYFFRTASNCVLNSGGDEGLKITRADIAVGTNRLSTRLSKVTADLVGIAKDGRVIYGPRYVDGTVDRTYSPCELDICNGLVNTVVAEDGSKDYIYSYRASVYHPYLLGCFGPGTDHDVGMAAQFCSTNPSKCDVAVEGALSSLLLLFATVKMLLF